VDWLTFIAELVKSLAWPAAGIAAVLVFRRPLLDLIPALRRLRFKEFEIEFGRELLEAERRAILLGSSTTQGLLENEAAPQRLRQIASVSPSAAILEAWRDIEAAAVDVTSGRGVTVTGGMWELFLALKKEALLNSTEFALLNSLRQLRNKIAHTPEGEVVNEEQALRYAEIATRLAEALRKKGK
jgi:hypothetical protein